MNNYISVFMCRKVFDVHFQMLKNLMFYKNVVFKKINQTEKTVNPIN